MSTAVRFAPEVSNRLAVSGVSVSESTVWKPAMNHEAIGYVLRLGKATGPFSVWSPVLNAVWPPCSGSTMLIALRGLAMLVEDGRVGDKVELDELASLVGVAPMRFTDAVERAKAFGLLTSANDQLFVPLRVHGPEPELWDELPEVSKRVAQRVIAELGRGPWPMTEAGNS